LQFHLFTLTVMKTKTLILNTIAVTFLGGILAIGGQERAIANFTVNRAVFSASSPWQTQSKLVAQSLNTKLTGGPWSGRWDGNDGSIFSFTMQLSADSSNRVTGKIQWKMLATSNSSQRSKIGLTAIEYVSGTYDSVTRSAELKGQNSDDPNGVISLDEYRISFDSRMKSLEGKTRNNGNWKGEISGVADDQSQVLNGSFDVYANASEGISFVNNSNEILKHSFQARGTWTYNPSQGLHSAAGHPSYQRASSNYKLPGSPEGALIIRRLSGNGSERYEYVGTSSTIALNPGEKIWFVMNDSYSGGANYADNQGQLTVSYESAAIVAKKDEVVKSIPVSPNPQLAYVNSKGEKLSEETIIYSPVSIKKGDVKALFGPAHSTSAIVSRSGVCDRDICYFDIRQGGIGDCYLLGTLASIAHYNPSIIRNMIQDNGDETYTIRFFLWKDDVSETTRTETIGTSQEVKIRVDNKLPLLKESKSSIYAMYTLNPNNDSIDLSSTILDEKGIGIWAALIEKAYAIFLDTYIPSSSGLKGYNRLPDGSPMDVLSRIVGKPARVYMNWEEVHNFPSESEIQKFFSINFPGNILVSGSRILDPSKKERSSVEPGHAYSVISIDKSVSGGASQDGPTQKYVDRDCCQDKHSGGEE
jgi:hypothetical protein